MSFNNEDYEIFLYFNFYILLVDNVFFPLLVTKEDKSQGIMFFMFNICLLSFCI